MSRLRASGIWRRFALVVAVNLAAATAIVMAADVFLRNRGYEPYVRTYPGEQTSGSGVPWARPDPDLGWTIDPAYLPGQINPQGFRDPHDLADVAQRGGVTRVMLLGDSFVV